jgi:cell division septation protein DedD
MKRDYKPRGRRAGGFSGWLGVACGLGLGLAVAAGVYLEERPDSSAAHGGKTYLRKSPSVDAPGVDAPGVDTPDAEGGDSAASVESESARSYDFYSMLPKFEVVVPEKDKDVKPDIRGVPETRRGTYVLQAGSYKNFADADRVRAQLALQGVESKVQKVSVDNDTWHRIRIGPISKLDELNRLRTILRRADVDVLVIRVGD